ncbi:ADP-ribosylating toxin [Pseudomonas syringae]|nr:ADP-ribosylating toxin [Pseudomonas syringae]MBD8788574.1 ADP-ribosylating toxin [Pseudomonas syringae]MBD8801632.1 ADP-ribosylating toxin [Pseudomonas syringae]MBD8811423.1 ADP-ribosylating toxin [Pseudomonas syringae]
MSRSKPNYSRISAAHRYITGELELKSIARQLVDDYPDIHALAYAQARQLLFRHTGTWLDPDQVWWHRFSSAVSSPRTFTGWEHAGQPVESMTFVELLIKRFGVSDQVAADQLQLYGGFYNVGPQARVFNEHNEIRLLAGAVLDDFWALDFSSLFTASIDRFWERHSEHFCLLARAGFLGAAGMQLRDGQLSVARFKTLSRVVIDSLPPVMTRAALATVHTPGPGITPRTFDIGGYVCAQCMRLVDENGSQYLYMPGDRQAFHVFEDEQALYAWVRAQLSDHAGRAAFKQLFLRSASSRQLHEGFLDDHVQQILDTPWAAGQTLINQDDRVISGDVFVYLRDIAKEQMKSDAQTLLTSNVTLRKQIWLGYLNAFINVFGALAPLSWPLTLTLVGAGTVALALNIDQARHARDPRQRKAAIIGAVLDALFVTFNLGLLAGQLKAGAGQVAAGQGADLPLAPESIELINLSPPPVGSMRGIQLLVNGETWISIDDVPRRVLFSDALGAWVIDDPVGPDAGRVVQLDADAQWQWQTSEPAPSASESQALLNHEAPSRALATVQSSFWDTYMQFNLEQEERLSQIALQRQRLVIDLPALQPADQVLRDVEGNEIHIDTWGNTQHVFKKANGDYVGGRLKLYSLQDSAFNTYLRSGVSQGPGQVRFIEELADDLQVIGHDNSVTLYRGGSGLRSTSGLFFRTRQIKTGDVLVNTDFLSFSENPYIARVFCSSQSGEHSLDFAAKNVATTFDDTSVVFRLPARYHFGATPIAPFSNEQREVESLFRPGNYFLIDGIEQVTGPDYRFIKVELIQIPQPKSWHRLFDLRSGEAFSREGYAHRLGAEGRQLVERFFPVSLRGLEV